MYRLLLVPSLLCVTLAACSPADSNSNSTTPEDMGPPPEIDCGLEDGTKCQASPNTPGEYCCPMSDQPSCSCDYFTGGSVSPGGTCEAVCDGAPEDWEIATDEHGCQVSNTGDICGRPRPEQEDMGGGD